MLDLFHIAKPQNCDIQIFYGAGSATTNINSRMWTKPRGVSNIYILVIGSGGDGNGSTGGGSSAVTVWYGAAQNVPDNLLLRIQQSGIAEVYYPNRSSTAATLLLAANNGSGSTGGAASTANYFAASGFYQSVAGQNGTTGAVTASSATFLAGGGAGGNDQDSNYGYVTRTDVNKNGFLLMQPIIVGMGGMGTGRGGIGCGGGSNGAGGQGMVLIASW